jgi:fructokinase
MSSIVCYGEVLWDMFPSHKTIGGAPLNVALRLGAFGHKVTMVSAIGEDEDGKKICTYLDANHILTNHIQIESGHATGQVHVALDSNGVASYTIAYPCAWDRIRLTPELKAEVERSDALIFGSLATRDKVSGNTLHELLKTATYKVFDVNLRPPHYNMDRIHSLMLSADLIKFNDEELFEICRNYGFPSQRIDECVSYISENTQSKRICVTLGKDGAVLYVDKKFYKNKGYTVQVKDTVGAGDSFLASLVHCILTHTDPQESLDFACAVGALVASNDGANPKISGHEIEQLITS